MSELKDMIRRIRKFNAERDWSQFHNYKDLALSLVLESAEVLEHFQWQNGDQLEKRGKERKEQLAEELADVTIYLLQLTDKLKIDLSQAVVDKIKKNSLKYPISKSKGSAKKYTEL